VAAYEDNPYPSGGGAYRGNLADVLWMLLCGLAVLLPLSWWLHLPVVSFSLFFMVLYCWSLRNPDEPTTFYFIRVPAKYLPWVMVAFSFVIGDDPVRDLLGIAAGHAYYFLQEVAPVQVEAMRGWKVLATPTLLYRWLSLEPTYAPPAQVRLDRGRPGGGGGGGGNAWAGQGHRLG